MNAIILIIVLLRKRPFFHADYSALCKEIESSHNSSKLKLGNRVRTTKYKNVLFKDHT